MSAKTNKVIEYDQDAREHIRVTYTNGTGSDYGFEARSCMVGSGVEAGAGAAAEELVSVCRDSGNVMRTNARDEDVVFDFEIQE